MGLVVLADFLIELYCISMKSKRFYMRIFYWTLNITLLYHRHHGQLKTPCKNMSHLQFQAKIAVGLTTAAKDITRKMGRPSKDSPSPSASKKHCAHRSVIPIEDVRYDTLGHWPVHSKKEHCKMCPKVFSRISCSKCRVNLCLTGQSNCFLNFHRK
ncbi:hypothetical protein PR048_032950 [Dryococelus australis]|uniref:PiggyBac transposable element-derived protein 4 C-terminal zinc-ribbon domain-containing protein n=1 Tax=Dryococelus australis TaxID=614101 RepID=A0ABQ9G6U6_9NEOP|nr:hypothetical protein PR048_032950 [Dryococelus australis]